MLFPIDGARTWRPHEHRAVQIYYAELLNPSEMSGQPGHEQALARQILIHTAISNGNDTRRTAENPALESWSVVSRQRTAECCTHTHACSSALPQINQSSVPCDSDFGGRYANASSCF